MSSTNLPVALIILQLSDYLLTFSAFRNRYDLQIVSFATKLNLDEWEALIDISVATV